MVFSSLEFLFFFLPTALVVYFVAPRRSKNVALLLFSLAFYAIGGGPLIVLLLTSIAVDYAAALIVTKGHLQGRPTLARSGVGLSVGVNVGILAYFKYVEFFAEQLNATLTALGIGGVNVPSVVLPIGISFYTFQSMSYTIDVYRGRVERLTRASDFGLFVSLFPQLIAGPIVRFHEIDDQIRNREASLEAFSQGVVRFSHGLAKKVIIADSVAPIADASFAAESLATTAAWIGVLAYAIQIYYDFSGYSDMAIGLGLMFGFRLPENFARPYSAVSVTDFWRRWHITLSNWFRDYVYIPLGGSRAGSTYRNLWIVFLLTGLWHGANWTFVMWGVYHGALLAVERVLDLRAVDGAPALEPVRRAITFLLVLFGWVLFRADSVVHAANYAASMVGLSDGSFPVELALALDSRATIVLVFALFTTLLMPRTFIMGLVLTRRRGRAPAVARVALFGIALPYAIGLVASGTFSPFLYYQF